MPEPDLLPDEVGVGEAPADGVDSDPAEGVGSDAADGGSPLPDEEDSGVEVAATGAAAGRTSFTCRAEDAADVPRAEEPATSPTITPNPRNIITSTAETREEGREGSIRRGRRAARRAPAAGAVPEEPAPSAIPASPMLADPPSCPCARTRPSSCSS